MQQITSAMFLTPREFKRVWRRRQFEDSGIFAFDGLIISFLGLYNNFNLSKVNKAKLIRRPLYIGSLMEKLLVPFSVYIFCVIFAVFFGFSLDILLMPSFVLILSEIAMAVAFLWIYFNDIWLEVSLINDDELKTYYFSIDTKTRTRKEHISYLQERLLGNFNIVR